MLDSFLQKIYHFFLHSIEAIFELTKLIPNFSDFISLFWDSSIHYERILTLIFEHYLFIDLYCKSNFFSPMSILGIYLFLMCDFIHQYSSSFYRLLLLFRTSWFLLLYSCLFINILLQEWIEYFEFFHPSISR